MEARACLKQYNVGPMLLSAIPTQTAKPPASKPPTRRLCLDAAGDRWLKRSVPTSKPLLSAPSPQARNFLCQSLQNHSEMATIADLEAAIKAAATPENLRRLAMLIIWICPNVLLWILGFGPLGPTARMAPVLMIPTHHSLNHITRLARAAHSIAIRHTLVVSLASQRRNGWRGSGDLR